MKSNKLDTFALYSHLMNAYLADYTYCLEEGFSLAVGMVEHFELEVSMEDIYDTLYMVEEDISNMMADADFAIPF